MTLSMRRSKCEGCGCDWDHPCIERPAVPGVPAIGCHWNQEYWKAGRAVCSVCVTKGKVAS